ncbi:KilA-N domain-containing protein [Desulfonema magnum]|uniref:DNA-binding domain-containing protein, KilA-N-like n=1 Tax=Desulfonema magnum TaxID=45655 RepID=A0A975GLJ2_9BACT|nr:KilA-N domain-containing protein [Desulfonema magnum]QTA85827.1 DNA-binding domain-containing protein, KilA-N-like [Desulfonema magnum]
MSIFICLFCSKQNLSTGYNHFGIISKTTRGRNGGTYAHWQIALAYAKYLSHELHMHVNEVYMRYRSGDVTLADEIADKASSEDQEWLAVRTIGKIARNQFTGTLKEHDVRGRGYADCTNVVYEPILGGTAKEVRQQKGLPVKANVRETLNIKELLAVGLSEVLSKEKIEGEALYGNKKCKSACSMSAEKVQSIL